MPQYHGYAGDILARIQAAVRFHVESRTAQYEQLVFRLGGSDARIVGIRQAIAGLVHEAVDDPQIVQRCCAGRQDAIVGIQEFQQARLGRQHQRHRFAVGKRETVVVGIGWKRRRGRRGEVNVSIAGPPFRCGLDLDVVYARDGNDDAVQVRIQVGTGTASVLASQDSSIAAKKRHTRIQRRGGIDVDCH